MNSKQLESILKLMHKYNVQSLSTGDTHIVISQLPQLASLDKPSSAKANETMIDEMLYSNKDD